MRLVLPYSLLLLLLVVATDCASLPQAGRHSTVSLLERTETGGRYNLQLDFGKHHMSGLLVVRRQPSGALTFAGVTYFGLSIFQFTLDGTTWTTHSCLAPLAKPKVLALLQRDLGVLFCPGQYAVRRNDRKDGPGWAIGRGLGRTVWQVHGGDKALLRHPWLRMSLRMDAIKE